MAAKAQLTNSGPIAWSGGSLFNGYVLLTMTLPSKDGTAWVAAYLAGTRPSLRIPTRVKVPIKDGEYDSQTRIWQTTSIAPPNVRYSAFFYDNTDRLIAVGASLFAVTTETHTLAPPVLTEPT